MRRGRRDSKAAAMLSPPWVSAIPMIPSSDMSSRMVRSAEAIAAAQRWVSDCNRMDFQIDDTHVQQSPWTRQTPCKVGASGSPDANDQNRGTVEIAAQFQLQTNVCQVCAANFCVIQLAGDGVDSVDTTFFKSAEPLHRSWRVEMLTDTEGKEDCLASIRRHVLVCRYIVCAR